MHADLTSPDPVRLDVPGAWSRRGLVLPRQDGVGVSSVSGDPCIVWDEDAGCWRMVLFYDPPGHAQAVCASRDDIGPGRWVLEGPLPVTNPEAIGRFHKPFLVMDPHRRNRAARIGGRYYLLVVSMNGPKEIHRAWAERLAGPWTFDPRPIIPRGGDGDFDAKHTDAVTGYYFPERQEFLYFYMGYPKTAQAGRPLSPFGSAQAVATQRFGEAQATKRGIILPPCPKRGHWASGYLGGLQLLPGRRHRWIAILNASPTAPDPGLKDVWTEEPPPSLGGFAWCDEPYPVSGWHFAAGPMEWIEEVPAEAQAAGEGYNLWRHFAVVLPDGRLAVYYNSGYYGREQLYLKESLGEVPQ